MNENDLFFSRTELLIGREAMLRMERTRVILFGVGGVGSWCAESLVRSGVRRLTLVDSDRVSPTNINRQLPATRQTVGRVKVDVLKERLAEINPEAAIDAIAGVYNADTAASFGLEEYDYIIDAIDSLQEKVHLIRTATRLPQVTFFSSMGAALKADPQRIRVAKFRRVAGCPLAAAPQAETGRTASARLPLRLQRRSARKSRCTARLARRRQPYAGLHLGRPQSTHQWHVGAHHGYLRLYTLRTRYTRHHTQNL